MKILDRFNVSGGRTVVVVDGTPADLRVGDSISLENQDWNVEGIEKMRDLRGYIALKLQPRSTK